MNNVVLDASAVLAMIYEEPGQERVEEMLPHSLISTVNLSEVIAKVLDRQPELSKTIVLTLLDSFKLNGVDFDDEQAEIAGELRRFTKEYGLSLGDRCCLALAKQTKLKVLTADRQWAQIDLGVEIELIR